MLKQLNSKTKCKFCKQNATFVNETQVVKRRSRLQKGAPKRGRVKFQNFEIQNATPNAPQYEGIHR